MAMLMLISWKFNIANCNCMFHNLTKILHFHSPLYRGCPPVLLEEIDFTCRGATRAYIRGPVRLDTKGPFEA
ncbi:hypothetical protein JHK86_045273 [Glycine max]|nr:hypothetical protein JHK86_045273 [Glycine max]